MRRILLLSACAASMWAQTELPLGSEFRREGEELRKNCFSKIFGCLQTLATGKPLHLTGGNIAPQNGFGIGGAFVHDRNYTENWRLSFNADAVGTTNGSWRAGMYLKALYTPSAPPVVVTGPQAPTTPDQPILFAPVPELNFYAQGTSLSQVHYYGLGQFTEPRDLALFGMREGIIGGNATYPLGRTGLGIYGELNGRWVDIRGHTGGDTPSIELLYREATAPGLVSQPGFLQTGEGLKFARAWSRLHLNYAAVYRQFTAVSESRYSFRRLTLDFDHEIPLYSKQRFASPGESVGPDESPKALENPRFVRNRQGSIGLRALLVESYTGRDSVVPFYFQPTLGGADINNNWLLPSYPDYRFRAPNLMLFRASIEHSIWGPIGAMAMADTGRVGLTRGELGFEHLRHSYAAGLTIRAGGLPQVLLLIAWGGHEGTHKIAYLNPALLGGGARPPLD